MPSAMKVIVWWLITQVRMGLSGSLPFACSCWLLSCHKWGLPVGQLPPEHTAAVGHEAVLGGSGTELLMNLRARAPGRPVPACG